MQQTVSRCKKSSVTKSINPKYEANGSKGSWVMIGQTNKQKDKERLHFIYIEDINTIIQLF